MPQRRWYHWITLVLVLLLAGLVGILDLTMGASADSPHFNIDDAVIRIFGVGFIVAAILILIRNRMGFVLVAGFFLLGATEVVVVWLLGQAISNSAVAGFVALSIAFAVAALWIAPIFSIPRKAGLDPRG